MSKKKKTDRNIRGRVLSVFKENPSKLFNYKQIAAKLNIKDTQKRNSVIKSLGQLCAQKVIDQKEPGKYVLLTEKKDYIEGIIEMTSSGNAYLLVLGEEEDIFIARRNTNRSLMVIAFWCIKLEKEKR
jgi:ribonuclease R